MLTIDSEEIYLPSLPFLLTFKDIYNTFLLEQDVAKFSSISSKTKYEMLFYTEQYKNVGISQTYLFIGK